MSNLVGKLFRGERLTKAELKQLHKGAMPGAVAALGALSINKGLITALSKIAACTGRYLPNITPKAPDEPKAQRLLPRLERIAENLQTINRRLVVRTPTPPLIERPSDTVH